ncbi:SAVED domain-containing protein [Geotalea uraniireducens]|uniref:SMODS-associated and fused to various effectors domain-containing protein n=1 Tax=Geotalea uraniireducens (strain Rf4) TaxID=351605 RepID=A5G3M7_GEOUR|nr:SAVED domain-containing protein [Geotalea uraniireducens]ABQ26395.1 hypothetical protein Gura_2210 [Geotalea uraniireducens Rf4]
MAEVPEKKKKAGRIKIPDKVVNQLWARAAGRCQFRGCNDILYSDDLTKLHDNLAVISHIIAYEPNGPRGNPVDSFRLATDISNLMLTCRKHGKIIDSIEHVPKYPVALLREYKTEHEKRIKVLTGIQEDSKTHVLIFQAPIAGKTFHIDQAHAFQAILPKYPADENAYIIDLSDIPEKETGEGYWPFLSRIIKTKFDEIFNQGVKRREFNHISVFALAPIPLLVFLGNLIGDKRTVDLYQRHLKTDDWKWKESPEELSEQYYSLCGPEEHDPDAKTAVIISISSSVNKSTVSAVMGDEYNCYELSVANPSRDFLSKRSKLKTFSYEYRRLLEILRTNNGHNKPIHLFCAVPAPVAIECGRLLLPKSDPPIMVYDFINDAGGYTCALAINRSSVE